MVGGGLLVRLIRTKFDVCLQVGGVLNVHMVAPSVSVSIVSEHQANQLLTSQSSMNKRREDYNSGDILNSQGTMEYQQSTKQVSVSFRYALGGHLPACGRLIS